MERLTQGLTGKLFGDKGYISRVLRENLLQRGLELITKLKRNMKTIPITDFDNALLRKRSLLGSNV